MNKTYLKIAGLYLLIFLLEVLPIPFNSLVNNIKQKIKIIEIKEVQENIKKDSDKK